MTKSITIQNIDESTAKWLSDEAERRGMSIDAVVLQLIHNGIGMEHKRAQVQTYHDLDSLAGTWSDEEMEEFLNAIADFDRVDEQLWR